jgi:thiosulfate/3-mercaptopyruvate sulfurtransferase
MDDAQVTSNRELLIDVVSLAADLAADLPLVLVDVRWSLAGPPGIEAYRVGHLPGARFADLDTELAGRRGVGGRHPLPEPADFEILMRRIGVSSDSAVVVYDAADGVPASRAWWDMGYFGHRHVRVLDGGYAAWVAAGFRVSTDEPSVVPGNFVAHPGGLPILDADLAAKLATGRTLIDVRVGERFRGEVEPVDAIAGHIPGAVNLPTGGNIGPDGKFLDVQTLARRFDSAGIGKGEAVGVYCGSGVNAAHTAFAMTLAGLPTPALYVGSWSNWIADGTRPIATGAN